MMPTGGRSAKGATRIEISARLDYQLFGPTSLLLQVEAAAMPDQAVEHAHIDIGNVTHITRVPGHDAIGERIWIAAENALRMDYSATVTINRHTPDLRTLDAIEPHLLPGDVIEYLMPSRYCPSDRFENLVDADFGDLTGGARVLAIRDWVYAEFTYVPQSSNASTDALETFVSRQGVCRDYAHVLISLVRASSIPARFVSAYAPDVTPQDFHAVAEVFLDGGWHLVDATGMAEAGDMVRIGVGRDAADVSFLTSFGGVQINAQDVQVSRV